MTRANVTMLESGCMVSTGGARGEIDGDGDTSKGKRAASTRGDTSPGAVTRSRSIACGGPTGQKRHRPTLAKQLGETDGSTSSRQATLRSGRSDQVPLSNFARRMIRPTSVKQLCKADDPTSSHRTTPRGRRFDQFPSSNRARRSREDSQHGVVHLWAPAPQPRVTRLAGAHLYLLSVKTRKTLLIHASHDKARRPQILP
jgi:hypothetical protein